MDFTLLVSALVFLALIGGVTAVYSSGNEPSVTTQYGGKRLIRRSSFRKVSFMAYLFLAIVIIGYITSSFY
jgi:hypothetical protein